MTAPVDTRRATFTNLEVRANSEEVTVEGYACAFDHEYPVGWFTESIAPGAFTKTLSEQPDVRFLVNHDGLPLARTTSGTLDLAQDSTGLHTRARLDATDPDVQRIVPKIRRGDLNKMSFGFRCIRDEWSDGTIRSVREASLANGDVSVVTNPANAHTSIAVRSQISTADPTELRTVYWAIREERAGKTISATTQKQLEQVLENLDTIDEAQDSAVQTIAELLGTVASATAQRSGTPTSVVRERLRLAGLAL